MAHTASVVCLHQRSLTLFAAPGRWGPGPGATDELGRELKRLGLAGPVLCVASGTARPGLEPIWLGAAAGGARSAGGALCG